jgi:hypothetical protein
MSFKKQLVIIGGVDFDPNNVKSDTPDLVVKGGAKIKKSIGIFGDAFVKGSVNTDTIKPKTSSLGLITLDGDVEITGILTNMGDSVIGGNIAAGVTSISATNGLQSTPNPIIATGTVAWIGYSAQETVIQTTEFGVNVGAGNAIQLANASDPGTWVEATSSANFTFDDVAGTITCNTTGVYLIVCSLVPSGQSDVQIQIDGVVVPGTICLAGSIQNGQTATVPVFITAGQIVTLVSTIGASFAGEDDYGTGSCVKLFRLG